MCLRLPIFLGESKKKLAKTRDRRKVIGTHSDTGPKGKNVGGVWARGNQLEGRGSQIAWIGD
jgi:hypothetical protein